MSVTRKPKVEEFIMGATLAQHPTAANAAEKSVQPVKLRLDPALLAQIDGSVNARRPAPSRHQWILEAIYEKLEREASFN